MKRESKIEKADHRKRLANLYKPRVGRVHEVEVPEFNFLMVDGKGNPYDSPDFIDAIMALNSVSYVFKFYIKDYKRIDYRVMPLEALFWTDDMKEFTLDNKSIWKWTLMIMQPDYISADMMEEGMRGAYLKKKHRSLELVRFESFKEGPAMQAMHVGFLSDMEPTVVAVHHKIKSSGRVFTGKHHEIYLNDIRRTPKATWRIVIRQPCLARSSPSIY